MGEKTAEQAAPAEQSAPVVDREALARMLGSEQDDRAADAPRFEGLLLHPRQARAIAAAIIASGVVRDAAQVRREQIERDAHIAEQMGPTFTTARVAAAIREQRS
jgi:hypothetical protein